LRAGILARLLARRGFFCAQSWTWSFGWLRVEGKRKAASGKRKAGAEAVRGALEAGVGGQLRLPTGAELRMMRHGKEEECGGGGPGQPRRIQLCAAGLKEANYKNGFLSSF